jgi:two-component system CheB/CheR fusion protein
MVRELCIFAPHNALSDPPFSRMDMVSCRNLLIYLQGGPQRKLLPLLHYALKPAGVLFLGASESINNYRDLFDLEDSRHRIYVKRPVSAKLDTLAEVRHNALQSFPGAQKVARQSRGRHGDRHRAAELVALKYFAPAGVLVDSEGEVLQFRGDTSAYLSQAEGRASLNIFKIAREGLFRAIRDGLDHAAARTDPLCTEGVVVRNDAGLLPITVTLLPVNHSGFEEPWCWIFFSPADAAPIRQLPEAAQAARKADLDADTARQITVLTDELMATREHLESTIEDQEAANEDLQAANEEVQSANEELQSTNEELETSKEEIQSANEELTTVNDELRLRNEELDRANNDLMNVFSSIDMAVVMVWPDLKIRRFTPIAETIFNIRSSDVGRPIADMRHQLEIDNFKELLAESVAFTRDIEREVQTVEGHSYLLRLRPYRTHDGDIDGAIILLIDIDTLAQTQEMLRKRIAELAAADRHKNEFLAILAHELRNPLAPLRNAAQILHRSPGDVAVTAKARELIDRQVHHMSRLVSDLLDAARAENGQIKLQRAPVDLRSCVEHVAEVLSPIFESKRQTLRVTLPAEAVWIDGDSTRLEQIFMNLLNNANKYTPDRGEVEINLSTVAAAEDKRRAIVRVIDNGEGIDSELLPRLFELFTQADRSLAHSQGGLGIGLSLVRTLVEMHGGRVSIRSEGVGKGSTFEVSLPVTQTSRQDLAPQVQPATAQEAGERRILLVEDNADVRESSCELLSMAGFEVTGAATGFEALAKAPAFVPNAVLVDVGLPDLSGYEVARRLRGMPQFATTMLIALTGYDTPETHALSAAAGFDHYLCKPVDFDELAVMLNSPNGTGFPKNNRGSL